MPLPCGVVEVLVLADDERGVPAPRKPGPNASCEKNRCGAMLTKFGSSASASPSSFATSEPSSGTGSGRAGKWPVRIR